MRYLDDLTANPKQLQALGQEGKIEGMNREQGRPGDGHERLLGAAVHRPYATADERTDSMIIGIEAAHAGAPAAYHMCGAGQSISQSSSGTRQKTHQQYSVPNN